MVLSILKFSLRVLKKVWCRLLRDELHAFVSAKTIHRLRYLHSKYIWWRRERFFLKLSSAAILFAATSQARDVA